jgi:nucleolar protein 56
MEIYKKPIGVLVMDDDKLKDKIIFKKDPVAIAKKLASLCDEERQLKKKYPGSVEGKVRLPLAELAQGLGFCNKSEFPEILSKINHEISKKGVSKGFGKDKLIVNAVRAQRALENNVNTESETLREWYSIHFPELNNLLNENLDYAKVVSEIGQRKDMSEASLSKLLDDKRYVRAIPAIAKDSMGTDIGTDDLGIIQKYAKTVLGSAKQENKLREYITKNMEAIAPNISKVATPYVGALLLEQSGSLERMAKLPSSTIQVLGAQKAMFRFLKTHTKPPKYGVLYVHPLVSQASKKSKGKIARTLASKISIAAKVDFYGGEPIGDRLKKESEERASSLKV